MRKQIINRTIRSGFLLTFFIGAFFLFAGSAPALARDQEPEMLNRLVQASNTSDAALKAFVEGRDFISDSKWAKAAERFGRFINDYPQDVNVDAAYYYLAFSFKKQNKFKDAATTLEQLMEKYPNSSWKDDAQVMLVEMAPQLGQIPDVTQEGNIEIKVIALQGLFTADPVRALAFVSDILKPGNRAPLRLKEAAITLLGKYGGKQATPALINIVRTEPDEKLRVKAIAALGRSEDESALEILREQALKGDYSDEGPVDTALHAIARNESPRAIGLLGGIATSSKFPKVREHAIYLLAQMKGEPVVDELFRIYDAERDIEVRKQAVAGLANRQSPRAQNKLIEIARSSTNLELREQAISSLGRRTDDTQFLDILLQLYDAEKNEELKDGLLSAIGRSQQQRALQKLMSVVKSNEPVERRKKAITYLSRSKNPEVLKFLEGILLQ